MPFYLIFSIKDLECHEKNVIIKNNTNNQSGKSDEWHDKAS